VVWQTSTHFSDVRPALAILDGVPVTETHTWCHVEKDSADFI